MGKKEEGTELEGLIAEDGSRSVDEGLTLVEYKRRTPAATFYADMAPMHKARGDSKAVPKHEQNSQGRKRGTVAVLEKVKKKSAFSRTGGKKGGRK